VDNINDEHIQSFINMCTDTFFLYGHNRTIEYFLQQNMQVFQYLLTYEGAYSFINIYGYESLGVAHADDLMYLFDPIYHGLLPDLPEKGA
jgi:carboxylesterase type B